MRVNDVLFFTTLLALSLGTAMSAHSRRRPGSRRIGSEPRYDRSITTFDSDGRLRQVEYGMEASRRGDSVAAIVVADLVLLAVDSSSDNKVHRIDSHILMVTAGLAGDGQALASALRESCQRFRLSFGEAPTVEEVARMAADIQHELTRTAGSRPLGCTAIVAGFDRSMQTTQSTQSPQVYQTEPGGIMEQCTKFCTAGANREAMFSFLEKHFNEFDGTSPYSADEDVTSVLMTLLKEINKAKGGRKLDLWCLQNSSGHKLGGNIFCFKGMEEKNTLSVIRRLQQQD